MLTRASKSTTNQRLRTKNPRSCVRVVYIAVDTLRHQPMGTGHVTVLQLRGPMAFRVLPWWLFLAGDTLCQHPMRMGHMTVLQSCGLMEFRALQWCHPMLASTRRTSCCTRMITLYGARKWIQARTYRVTNFLIFLQQIHVIIFENQISSTYYTKIHHISSILTTLWQDTGNDVLAFNISQKKTKNVS